MAIIIAITITGWIGMSRIVRGSSIEIQKSRICISFTNTWVALMVKLLLNIFYLILWYYYY